MASEKASSQPRGGWTPEMNHKLFLALLEASAIDYAAVAQRLGEGQTRDTVYQRIYNLKNGRVKNFVMAASGSSTTTAAAPVEKQPKTKKRKLNVASTTDVKDETD